MTNMQKGSKRKFTQEELNQLQLLSKASWQVRYTCPSGAEVISNLPAERNDDRFDEDEFEQRATQVYELVFRLPEQPEDEAWMVWYSTSNYGKINPWDPIDFTRKPGEPLRPVTATLVDPAEYE